MDDSQRKTANLLNPSVLADGYHLDTTTGLPTQRGNNDRVATLTPIDVSSISAVTLSYLCTINDANFMYSIFDANDTLLARVTAKLSGDSIDVSNAAKLYIAFYGNSAVTISSLSQVMLNEGSTALLYEPYGWQHSLRKFGTATETITSGDTIYADGTAATVSLKGNEQHTGTPTPSNPVEVNGVGERTENLFDGDVEQGTWNATITPIVKADSSVQCRVSNFIDVTENTQYTISLVNAISGLQIIVVYVDDNYSRLSETTWLSLPITFNTPTNCKYVEAIFRKSDNANIIPSECGNLMLNTGSTAKPYEPYGYKIPISNNSTTTPVYLGEVQTERRIKKYAFTGEEFFTRDTPYDRFVLTLQDAKIEGLRLTQVYCTNFTSVYDGRPVSDVPNNAIYSSDAAANIFFIKTTDYTDAPTFKAWLAQQYANGTPVTVWYVLETPQTGIVNEPLMKIGNYADTLSNATAIPTTEGANIITVDTTVQPSEFTATWTGWHDAEVKEWDGSQWD